MKLSMRLSVRRVVLCVVLLSVIAYGTRGLYNILAARRSCQAWFDTGTPSLAAISVARGRQTVYCDDPAVMQYLTECFRSAEEYPKEFETLHIAHSGPTPVVMLYFSDGTKFSTWWALGPTAVQPNGVSICIPGYTARLADWQTHDVPFLEPVPEKWRQIVYVLNSAEGGHHRDATSRDEFIEDETNSP